jgi:hypothetical protein
LGRVRDPIGAVSKAVRLVKHDRVLLRDERDARECILCGELGEMRIESPRNLIGRHASVNRKCRVERCWLPGPHLQADTRDPGRGTFVDLEGDRAYCSGRALDVHIKRCIHSFSRHTFERHCAELTADLVEQFLPIVCRPLREESAREAGLRHRFP